MRVKQILTQTIFEVTHQGVSLQSNPVSTEERAQAPGWVPKV